MYLPTASFPATANSGTTIHSYTHYPISSFSKINSKPKFTHNTWTLRLPSIMTCCHSNRDAVETIPTNPSMAENLQSMDPKPSSIDAHDLNQASSSSKSIWVNPNKPTKNHTWSPRIAEMRLLAKTLDSCEPTQEVIFEVLDSLQETLTPKDAMVIMNNIQRWEKAYFFFQWLNKNEGFEMDSVIYNVTMKVLRKGRQWDRVEELLKGMISRGIKPNNITYSTVISCARQCKLHHKAVEWFERMKETGCVPDEVTYTAMMDAYGMAGKAQEALDLYQRGRADGWTPDSTAFSILIKIHTISGDFDGAYNIFQEMKALGVKPNLVVYNTMFDALAKVGKPSVAKALFKEMTNAGLRPNQITLSCLLKIYGKARWIKDAMRLWDRMKKKGLTNDLVLYNTLLSMLADIGRVEEAIALFQEMHQSENCKPDVWSFTSMIDLFTSEGRVEEANRVFNAMMEAGFRPNIMVCTCLLQCYGRAKRFDDVVRTLNVLLDEGIFPDDSFCCSLLSILPLCEKEEFDKVLECVEKLKPNLTIIVKMLQEENINLEALAEKLETVFNRPSHKVRKDSWNSLIDLSHKLSFPERAQNLLHLGTKFGIYTNLYTKSPKEWCLNIHGLSYKAAVTAFDGWVSNLSKALEHGEEMPPLLGIQTGHGFHKHSFDQGLIDLFRSHLSELESPFEKSTERVGSFFATRDATISWLQSRKLSILTTV